MKSFFALVLVTLVAMTNVAFGANVLSAKSGDWADPSTWTSGLPTNGNTPYVVANHVVTFNVDDGSTTNLAGLFVGNTGGNDSTLTQNGGLLRVGAGFAMYVAYSAKSGLSSTGTYNLVSGTNMGTECMAPYSGAKATINQSGGVWSYSTQIALGYNSGRGTYNMSGGSAFTPAFVLGYKGEGVVWHSDGEIRTTGEFGMGTYNTAAAYGEYNLSGNARLTTGGQLAMYRRAKMVISGGIYTNKSSSSPAIRMGALAGGLAQIEVSGGKLIGVGSAATAMSLGEVANATGTVVQTGGQVELAKITAIGDAGVGAYTLSGGTFAVTNLNAAVSAGSAGLFHIIGTGCTGLRVFGNLDMEGSGTGTMRVHLDNGTVNGNAGVTLVDVGGNAALDNATFEVGVTNGFSGKVNDAYTVIRVPQAKSITTNGMALVNLSSGDGYEFAAELGNDGTYDLLKLVCSKAPASTAGTLVIVN